MAATDMARALQPFDLPQTDALVSQWATQSGLKRHIELKGVIAEIIIGDARETLAQWDGQADAWFLDGFAPARNPELWNESLMAQIGQHTAPGGTVATYTAAGHVRRALDAGGFEITRVPGFGRKKHMTVGALRG